MRFFAFASAVAFSAIAPYALLADQALTASTFTVGRGLEASATVKLAQATESGLTITLTSDDPSRLLLSEAPDKAGSATISVTILPRRIRTGQFWLQALADSGTATYTISAPDITAGKGTVKLVPSAIAIIGPYKSTTFKTTTHGQRSRITVVTVALDGSPDEQQVAGGSKIEVTMANSNPNVGTLEPSKVTVDGGASVAEAYFRPVAEGETSITPVQPVGFSAPPEYAKVVASVAKPRLSLTEDIYLGKDLQALCTVVLAEPAPPGGTKVTLTSSDASKMLVSAKEDAVGAGSVSITIAEGTRARDYFLQALSDSGDVTYTAEAPGFLSRTATIGLTKAGFILTYGSVAPDEGQIKNVLRKRDISDERRFSASVSGAKQRPIYLAVWSAYLARANGRAADISIQPPRAGVTPTVVLKSSDPAVGTMESQSLILKPGTFAAAVRFIPLSPGTTMISIDTPEGFTRPNNATSIPATVVP